jgi:hypothetical protein
MKVEKERETERERGTERRERKRGRERKSQKKESQTLGVPPPSETRAQKRLGAKSNAQETQNTRLTFFVIVQWSCA